MKKGVQHLIIRYGCIILFSLIGFFILSKIFTPLTINASFLLFNLFYDTKIVLDTLLINGAAIKLIAACVAVPAYYLLIVLNLAMPRITFSKRISLFLFTLLGFFVINILRIFFLGVLFVNGSSFFNFSHIFFWYILSTVFVVGLWFLGVFLFKVKEVPFYSDIKDLYKSLI